MGDGYFVWLNPLYCYRFLLDYYYDQLKVADKRVDGWLLTDSYVHTVCLSLAYVLLTIVGPSLMKNRPPINLRIPMLVYNFVMVLWSYYMFHEFFFGMIGAGYNYICDPVDYSYNPTALRLVAVSWWYYISKLVEFVDTFFFILRKKNNQISFLHVYHHATMPVVWWIGVKWAPNGSGAVQACINCFVHIIMYSYYFLSGLGPSVQKYLWWKKYVTVLQIVQFCVVISHTTHAFFSNCPFPKRIMYLNFFYVNSLLLLFINFYVRSYVMGRRGKVGNKKVTINGTKVTTNGTKVISNGTKPISNGTEVISNGTKVIGNGSIGVPLEDKKHQ